MVSPVPPLATDLPESLRPLVEGIRSGNRLALARAISVVENERTGFQALLHTLLSPADTGGDGDTDRSGQRSGSRVGITGPPGAGKSSLVTAMARAHMDAGEQVGVVAVDPTSPYSGGALLGDRIRMNDLATDPRIFIRSMASRGSLGGLATTTTEVMDVMDAAGFPRLLVETVGVGQTELEIAGTADTVVVVLVPESGDGIQAMKAGLMEIADIFVVNKSDRPGADRLVREIRTALHYRAGDARKIRVPAHHGVDLSGGTARGGGLDNGPDNGKVEEDAEASGSAPTWTPPVLQTIAHASEGVAELLSAIEEHRAWMLGSGELERRRLARTATRIRDVMDRELKRRVRRLLADEDVAVPALDAIASGESTPYSVAAHLLEEFS